MPDDLSKYASQTRFRLILWFLAILFFLGLGLVWVIYGREAAFLGFLCLIGATIPLGLIAIFLLLLDKSIKNRDD